MATKHGLGRGLGALIKDGSTQPAAPAPAKTDEARAGLLRVPVEQIRASALQPRRNFSREAMEELMVSVREQGVLQPLLVRQTADGYELIAGERRLRAAAEAGLTEVPVLVMDVADHVALELALVENLQRQDLNVIEEAEGYRLLGEKYGLTQDQIAQRVGKPRPSVTNALRLLGLPGEVQKFLVEGLLSSGHAKVLLGLESPEEQCQLAEKTVQGSLAVREVEKLVVQLRRKPRKQRAIRSDLPADYLAHLSDLLHQHFGTSVRITSCRSLANGKKTKGVLEVDFYSNDDLDRILQILGLTERI